MKFRDRYVLGVGYPLFKLNDGKFKNALNKHFAEAKPKGGES